MFCYQRPAQHFGSSDYYQSRQPRRTQHQYNPFFFDEEEEAQPDYSDYIRAVQQQQEMRRRQLLQREAEEARYAAQVEAIQRARRAKLQAYYFQKQKYEEEQVRRQQEREALRRAHAARKVAAAADREADVFVHPFFQFLQQYQQAPPETKPNPPAAQVESKAAEAAKAARDIDDTTSQASSTETEDLDIHHTQTQSKLTYEEAVQVVQKLAKQRIEVRQRLRALNNIRETFRQQRASFEQPQQYVKDLLVMQQTCRLILNLDDRLDFNEEKSQIANAPVLAFTPRNRPVQAYEEGLLKLLTDLDDVPSAGVKEIKDARKALAKDIQEELSRVDAGKLASWKSQQQPTQVVHEEQSETTAPVEAPQTITQTITPTPVHSPSGIQAEEGQDEEAAEDFEIVEVPESAPIVKVPESADIEAVEDSTVFDPLPEVDQDDQEHALQGSSKNTTSDTEEDAAQETLQKTPQDASQQSIQPVSDTAVEHHASPAAVQIAQ